MISTSTPTRRTNPGRVLTVAICAATCAALGLSASASAKKVTIRVAHGWEPAFLKVQADFDKEFMKRHPDIVVKMENTASSDRYITQAAAGSLPDVMYVHYSWAQMFVRKAIFLDLKPYIAASPRFDFKDMYDVALTPFVSKSGNICALPYDAGTLIPFYNATMFSKAGIPVMDKSWQLTGEFLNAAKKLTFDTNGDGKPDQWGIDKSPLLYWSDMLTTSLLKPFGGQLLSDDETECTVTDPKALAGLKYWTDLIAVSKVMPGANEGTGDPFGMGKAGMTISGSWMILRWQAALKGRIDVAESPSGPAGRHTAVMGSGYAIGKQSKNKQAAWTYLSEYLSKENIADMWGRTGRGSPSRRSAWPAFEKAWGDRDVRAFRNALDYASYAAPLSPAAPRVNAIAQAEVNAVAAGKKSVVDAANAIKRQVAPFLTRNRW